MSTENTAPTTPATAKKTHKPRAPKAQRQPRADDPQVAELKRQFKKQMADIKAAKRSTVVMRKIVEKMLPKLTRTDKSILRDALTDMVGFPEEAAASSVITGES